VSSHSQPGGVGAVEGDAPLEHSPSTFPLDGVLRVATYNIHKGVRGLGVTKRLEIHNLGLGVEALDADLVFLQEVQSFHHLEARQFQRTWFGWPDQGQAHFLAPEGYEVAYRTNAVTRHSEHGNALLSRWPLGTVAHRDVSDHMFEQRGLLHVPIHWAGGLIHTFNAHLGLIHASRVRQVQRLSQFILETVPHDEPVLVAGDFNDWGEQLDELMHRMGLVRASVPGERDPRTFPSRLPIFSLDRIYTRGFRCQSSFAPRSGVWARMSDHLPLVVELRPE
jgi:endonuclease/exonuclease/phosphatase family metal-dependent hydrolase